MNAPHDRDQALERLLRQSLKTPRQGATASCLDPETLASWAEGSLSGHDLEVAQSHVADCARCQASLAALVQLSSVDSDKSVSGAPEQATRRWFMWLVPLTAAAAVIAIWVAVPRGPANQPSQVAELESQAAQPKTPETRAPATGPQQPATTKEEQSTAAKRDEPNRDQAQASALSKDTERRELDLLKQEPQSADAAGDRADKLRPAAEPAAPAATPTAAAPAPPAAAAETRQAFQETSANAAAQKAAAARAPGSVASAVRWRISGTTLERSTDTGSTWSAATGVDAELTALSSPSPAVCWVVGRRGVVLRTTDGQNFSRLAFPETTDLSSVQATDAQSATVTARDGRSFTTADGGATWQQR